MKIKDIARNDKQLNEAAYNWTRDALARLGQKFLPKGGTPYAKSVAKQQARRIANNIYKALAVYAAITRKKRTGIPVEDFFDGSLTSPQVSNAMGGPNANIFDPKIQQRTPFYKQAIEQTLEKMTSGSGIPVPAPTSSPATDQEQRPRRRAPTVSETPTFENLQQGSVLPKNKWGEFARQLTDVLMAPKTQQASQTEPAAPAPAPAPALEEELANYNPNQRELPLRTDFSRPRGTPAPGSERQFTS